MEEWEYLIGDCEAHLDIPNCSGVIDWNMITFGAMKEWLWILLMPEGLQFDVY